MAAFYRVWVAFAVYALVLLLPSPAHGQKGRVFRPPPGRSPGTARGLFNPGRSGNLGVPPRFPSSPKGGINLGPSTRLPHPTGGGKFGTSVKVITSTAAAGSLGLAARAMEGAQRERAFLDDLRNRGSAQLDDCVYSIYFKVASGGWSDFFSNPDLFFYVDIEGQGSFLVPQIHWNYAGGPILDRVLARDVKPGSRIVVRVLDDDTWSDEIWNNIMRTRANIYLSPEIQLTRYITINLGYVGGQIQLLDRNVVIDAPDPVAVAEFVVPESQDGFWVANASLYDDSGTNVGDLRFACVQSTKREWQEHASAASGWLGSAVFWLVLGLCLLIWFFRQVFSKGHSTPAGSR